MSDTPVAAPSNALDLHPKVTVAALVGALVNVLIGVAKQHGYDLTGYEGDLVVLFSFAAGYFTPAG